MSKSISSPLGTIYLTDAPAEIDKKIKKAVTDTESEVRVRLGGEAGLSNLLEIYSSFTGEKPEEIATRYSRYGDLKSDLSTLVIESLAPIAARYPELRAQPVSADRDRGAGREEAAEVSGPVYHRSRARLWACSRPAG